MKLRHIYTITVLSAVVYLLSSCAKETQTEIINSSKEIPIQLNLRVPGLSSERSITVPEESNIATVDILAFNDNGSGMRFAYKATNVRIGVLSGNDLTVTATVMGNSSNQQFLVLANSSAELAGITISPGEELSTVVTKLVCAAGNGEYPARINGGGATYKPIPMYAKTTPQVITATGSIGDYPMLRMLARVNVTVKNTVGNFELLGAALYNFKKTGYIGYDFSGFNTTTNVATIAAVPAGNNTGDPILEPTVFHNVESGVINNSIFTYESPAMVEADRLKATALVVSGYYNGDKTKIFYYRIDLKTTDDVTPNLSSPILRNHSYNVEIQSVSGPGSDTGIDAYRGKVLIGVHIKADPWAEVDIDEDILGRKLSVSALEKELVGTSVERIYFNSNQKTVTLDAQGLNSSNNPVNITSFLENAATTNLHYNYNNSTKTGTGYIDLKASSSATDGTYRIYLNAGGLKREIKVTVKKDVIVPPGTLNGGFFAGRLLEDSNGDWQFEFRLFINQTDDASGVQWSTHTSKTDVQNTILGKQNTLDLNQKSLSQYPAANLCFKKNNNHSTISSLTDTDYIWYLPSQKQLMAVWVVYNSIDGLYRLTSNALYWTSTEYFQTTTNAWYVNVNDGGDNGAAHSKTNSTITGPVYVRCVREGL